MTVTSAPAVEAEATMATADEEKQKLVEGEEKAEEKQDKKDGTRYESWWLCSNPHKSYSPAILCLARGGQRGAHMFFLKCMEGVVLNN